jgi:anti-anti-sigma factor
MCAYSSALTRAALDDVTAVHPLVYSRAGAPAFQVFVDDAGDLALVGSVDTFSADRLARVLAASAVDASGVVLDLGRIEFLDVAGCRALAQWAASVRARSIPVQMHGASNLVRRMWQLLNLDSVAAVTCTEARV